MSSSNTFTDFLSLEIDNRFYVMFVLFKLKNVSLTGPIQTLLL